MATYRTSLRDAEAVAAEIDRVWEALRTDAALSAQLGVPKDDLDRLLAMPSSKVFFVEQHEGGFDWATVIIDTLPILQPLLVTIATDLWKKLVLPRIQARSGDDSLEEQRESKEPREGPSDDGPDR